MKASRLLVPLDESEFSRKIVPHITRIIDPGSWETILFHAAPRPDTSTPNQYLPPQQVYPGGQFTFPNYLPNLEMGQAPHPGYPEQAWTAIESSVRRDLAPAMRELQQAGYATSVAVCLGDDAAHEIATFAEQAEVDLVAMASHGRTGLGRLLRGSVARELQRRLSIPMLLLHADDTDEVNEDDPEADHKDDESLQASGATIDSLTGSGIVTVQRAASGNITEVAGSWRPNHRYANLNQLEQAFESGETVLYEGPISDPAGPAAAESERARFWVSITGIRSYRDEVGDWRSLVNFVVLDAAEAFTEEPPLKRSPLKGSVPKAQFPG